MVAVKPYRQVRSFVRRDGRITPAQQRAFTEHWTQYGLDLPLTPLTAEQWQTYFPRPGPLALDIGFGDGESTLALAHAYPTWNIIGLEVYRPGVGRLLSQLMQQQISNVRVICHDAVEILQTIIPSDSLKRVQIFFPDPWQKKRHRKRRLIQAEFIALLADRLQVSGELLLATDWQPYAEHMAQVLMSQTTLHSAADDAFAPRDEGRPLTKFERRGQRAGHKVWDLKFLK